MDKSGDNTNVNTVTSILTDTVILRYKRWFEIQFKKSDSESVTVYLDCFSVLQEQ